MPARDGRVGMGGRGVVGFCLAFTTGRQTLSGVVVCKHIIGFGNRAIYSSHPLFYTSDPFA